MLSPCFGRIPSMVSCVIKVLPKSAWFLRSKALGTTRPSRSCSIDRTEGQESVKSNTNDFECEERSPLRSLKIGDKTVIERVISEEELNTYKKLTNDYNPLHTEWVGAHPPIVHGALLVGLLSSAFGTRLPGAGTILTDLILKFPKPCYIGEKVVVLVEIVSARKIIECKFECSVAGCKVVLCGTAKMVQSRSAAPSVKS